MFPDGQAGRKHITRRGTVRSLVGGALPGAVHAVHAAVVDRLAEVGDADFFVGFQVCDGATDTEDFVVSTCREAHLFHSGP